MIPKYYIGVDISKLTLDLAFLHPSGVIYSSKIANSEDAIQETLVTLKKEHGFKIREVAIVMEDMRVLSRHLLSVAASKRYRIFLESALRIKKSLGIPRGKSDMVDAIRIAQYAKKNFVDLRQWQPPRECIVKLMLLSSIRKRLIKIRVMLINGEKNYSFFMTKLEEINMIRYFSSTLEAVNKDIRVLEADMLLTTQQDERLSRLMQILTSIPFIGNVVAMQLLINTNEFYDFTEAKKFASHCGVAPFGYSSGTSVKGRTKVSYFSNKEMKSMLHLAVMGYISKPNRYALSRYYLRKVNEGKNKMSVINALRNKLIHRIFSCVNHNREYVDL